MSDLDGIPKDQFSRVVTPPISTTMKCEPHQAESSLSNIRPSGCACTANARILTIKYLLGSTGITNSFTI